MTTILLTSQSGYAGVHEWSDHNKPTLDMLLINIATQAPLECSPTADLQNIPKVLFAMISLLVNGHLYSYSYFSLIFSWVEMHLSYLFFITNFIYVRNLWFWSCLWKLATQFSALQNFDYDAILTNNDMADHTWDEFMLDDREKILLFF